MKKTKYIYQHSIYGDSFKLGHNDVPEFFKASGIKLHPDTKNDCYYSWEFAGDQCSWFVFSHAEEVDIEPKVTKLPPDTRYKNGYNWKNAHLSNVNSKLKKKSTNNAAEEKAQRDAEFFKFREEFRKRNGKK